MLQMCNDCKYFVDSVAGGDNSDGFIKYILYERIFCFDWGWNVIYPVWDYKHGQHLDYVLLFRDAHNLTSRPCAYHIRLWNQKTREDSRVGTYKKLLIFPLVMQITSYKKYGII